MQAIIIAGDAEDRDFLSFVLRRAGLAVARTADIIHVRSALAEYPVDLIVLVSSPWETTLGEIEGIRTITHAPLLLLVEYLTEAEHCALLDAGADLVLQRPISPKLLTRYAQMLLKRAGSVPVTVLPSIQAGDLLLDPETRQVSHAGGEMSQLTSLEFRLLYLLMTNQGHVIPTDTIVERVWGYSGSGNRELVRGLIRRLRRKIETLPGAVQLIENFPGVGYRFMDR